MIAPALELQAPADPFIAVRRVTRMQEAGFNMRLEAGGLVVTPSSRLTTEQRGFIQRHKAALVELLSDAHTLHEALITAGADGLAWRQGTPADWSDDRLLAADEVLYADGRMQHRNGRRYKGFPLDTVEADPIATPAAPPSAIDTRVAELMTLHWSRPNAEALAYQESELRRKAGVTP